MSSEGEGACAGACNGRRTKRMRSLHALGGGAERARERGRRGSKDGRDKAVDRGCGLLQGVAVDRQAWGILCAVTCAVNRCQRQCLCL